MATSAQELGAVDDSDQESYGSMPSLEPVDVHCIPDDRSEADTNVQDHAVPSGRFRIGVSVNGFKTEVYAEKRPGLVPELGEDINEHGLVAPEGCSQLSPDQAYAADFFEEDYGYPPWPEEMKDPSYFREELRKMSDPRYNRNFGRSIEDQEFWNEAARLPWAKVLMKREQHWTARRNVWLQQYNTVVRNNRGREEIGELLEECPVETKRLVAPILKYKVVEAVLLSVNEEAKATGVAFGEILQRPETLMELQSVRQRLDRGGSAEAKYLQDNLDAMMTRAMQVVAEEKRKREHARGRVLIDMQGLKVALDYAQKCKKDGLIEWQGGNLDDALASWRQGDEALRQFRAPAKCVNENNMIIDLHCAILNNLAQAAIKLGNWGEALDAADRVLQMRDDDCKAWFRRACVLEGLGRLADVHLCLDKIEEAAVGRADRDRIAHDCSRRREKIHRLEERHCADQQQMLQKGLRRGIFSCNRTNVQAEVAGRRLHAADALDRKGCDQQSKASTLVNGQDHKRLTREGAWDMLDALEAAYTEPWFVRRVDKLIRDVHFDPREFMRNLGAVALEAQKPVLERWGFEASRRGVLEMRAALRDSMQGPTADQKLKDRAEAVNKALHGSPGLRMYERISIGA